MTDTTKLLKLFYTFFLGVLLAVFIGVGIHTFYPGPQAPEFPVALNTYGKDTELTPEQVMLQKQWDQKTEAYNKAIKPYSRNVSMTALGIAVLFLAASIILEKRIKIIADGIMLGGLFTLLYSIGRGFVSENNGYVFVVLSLSVIVVLYLGFHRFVRPGTLQKDV